MLVVIWLKSTTLARSNWCETYNPCDEDIRRAEFGLSANNLTLFSDLALPFSDTNEATVTLGEVESKRVWFGAIFGVPMRLERTPDFHHLKRWLLDQESRWRKMPVNEYWPIGERTQLTSKYRSYNALAEALTSPDKSVSREARRLVKILKQSLIDLMHWVPKAPTCNPLHHTHCLVPIDEHFWRMPASVHFQSWINVHRFDVDGEREISMHKHDMSWHAYLLLDSTPSNTTYIAPAPRPGAPQPVFNLKNVDNVLVALPGGVLHGVQASPAQTGAKPRLSIAFDFVLSAKHQGRPVTHPGQHRGKNKAQRLDDGNNAWSLLMTAADLRQNLNSVGLGSPLAFDWEASAASTSAKSAWSGVISLSNLLGNRHHTSEL